MATTTLLTLNEFLALPETKPACEYADGEIEQKTMPTWDHSDIRRLLSQEILPPAAEVAPEAQT